MVERSDRPESVKRRSGLRWLLFGCGGFFLTMLAAGFGYLAWANSPFPPLEPEPPLPVPNGRDLCVAALTNRSEPPSTSPLTHPDTSPVAKLRQAISQPDPTAEKVRAALSHEYRNPANYSLNATFPELTHYRHLAKLWTAQARIALTEGKPEVAIEHCLDSVELGSRMPHGGGLLHHLVGVACQFIPLYQAEQAIPQLSAEAARRAGSRLDRILRQNSGAAEALEVERRAGLTWVRALFRGDGEALGITSLTGSALTHPLTLAFYPKPWTYERMDGFYRASIAEAKKPFPARTMPEVPRDPLCMILLPAFNGISGKLTQRDATLRLLRLELALQEYRARHGKYPASLDPLKATLAAETVIDPFTDKPFPYRVTNQGYRLYSLGYDGTDEGGVPVPSRKNNPNGTGDFVAGKLKEKD